MPLASTPNDELAPHRGTPISGPALRRATWPSLLLWSAAIMIGSIELVTQRWPGVGKPVIATTLSLAGAGLINRLRLGGRVPAWLNHVDAMAGTVLVSIVIHFDGRNIGEFSALYLLIGLFVAFFMPVRSAILYGCLIAVAYGVVLLLGPWLPNATGYWLTLVVVLAVIEALVLGLTEQLRQLAACDPLTGLPNRRAWDSRLELELRRAGRVGGGCSMAMLDLDGFKKVNDAYGHAAGDHVLTGLADCWRSMNPPRRAFLARLGGDEFGLLVRDGEAEEVDALVERLATSLVPPLTLSVGAATWDGHETAVGLTRRADHRMYLMKHSIHAAPLRHREERRSEEQRSGAVGVAVGGPPVMVGALPERLRPEHLL